MLRQTLISVGQDMGWDVSGQAVQDWGARPIRQLFAVAGTAADPYHLAKAYLDWTRDHDASDLTAEERIMWMKFIDKVNQALA